MSSGLYFRFPGFKTKAVTLSYDDGRTFDREMVEIANRHQIKCTFNLNSGRLGMDGVISREEVSALYRGHEVAVHTVDHPSLENLNDAAVAMEVLGDRLALEELTGGIVDGMAYPNGFLRFQIGLNTAERLPLVLQHCGIRYARTITPTHDFSFPTNYLTWNPTCHHTDPMLPELMDQFLVPEKTDYPKRIVPKLFYLWGHSYEFKNRFDEFEAICEKLGGHADIWYATNGEIIHYLDAYHSLILSANARRIYNPTATDVYLLTPEAKETIIPAGKTVEI